jgi:hypothetical protein
MCYVLICRLFGEIEHDARSHTDARARRNRSHPRRVPYAAQVTSHIAPGMPPPGALIIIRVIMPDALAPQSDSLSTTLKVFEQAKVQLRSQP